MKRFGFLAVVVLVCGTLACDSSTAPTLHQFTLTIAGTGSGEIAFNVPGASGSTCTAVTTTSCTARYSSSELVTLSATAAEGSVFAGWSGSCTGTGACALVMSGSRAVTATFTLE